MHTIGLGEKHNGEYRFECSCGVVGNWYGNVDTACFTGYAHKEHAEGTPDNADDWRDDPRMGY
jgi:hypothetical protein